VNRSASESRTRSQKDSRETHQHGDGRSRPGQAVHAAQSNRACNPHGTARIYQVADDPSGRARAWRVTLRRVKVGVVGAGYVGLVTAGCFAKLENDVVIVESDPGRLAGLRQGVLPISEPGLDDLIARGIAAGRITFASDPVALHGARLSIVCVGTLDGSGDWSAETVRKVVRSLAADHGGPRAIVVRSTLLPGTAAELDADARTVDPSVELLFNPEFTREGNAVADFLEPDRVVIGVRDRHSRSSGAEDLRHLYEPLEAPIVVTDLTSAEAIKVASNVFLAAKITFANELARLCAALGADVDAVVDGMGLDVRIGRRFLSPGPGFGGSCFPSQARALPSLAEEHGVPVPLMSAIAPSNEAQAEWLLDRLEAEAGRSLRGTRVALLGLSFKADTDDLRESPALRLAAALTARGAAVTWFDPLVTERGDAALVADGVSANRASSAEAACDGADAVVVATEWAAFRKLDWARIAPTMRGHFVLDARTVVNVHAATRAGLRVLVLGVPAPGGAAVEVAGEQAGETELAGTAVPR
jgi:UDPglucose 6-dehydrogenase